MILESSVRAHIPSPSRPGPGARRLPLHLWQSGGADPGESSTREEDVASLVAEIHDWAGALVGALVPFLALAT